MKHALLVAVALLNACALRESVAPTYEATVGLGPGGQFEIELPYIHEVQGGNVHMPWDLAKHTKQKSYWLYTKSREGQLNPEQFRLCFLKCDTSAAYALNNLKGSIQLEKSRLVVSIQESRYKDGKPPASEWVESKFNGEWHLNERQQ